MDFSEFEQLVLRVLFETDAPVTAAHLAYLGRVSVRTSEKYLARMVEQGTLGVKAGAGGVAEYVYPRRRVPTRAARADAALTLAEAGPPGIAIGMPMLPAVRETPNPVTAVLLSMVIPGAGHIYTGRAGAGVAWMAATLMGYACFFLPGLFLHGLCLVSAAQGRSR